MGIESTDSKNNSEDLIQNATTIDLKIINGISFTEREIDIIACVLSGKMIKKVAQLLSISPRTVGNHIRNIMIKLNCNSQEGIIEFIEKSDKFINIKNHYIQLLFNTPFEQELRKTSLSEFKMQNTNSITHANMQSSESNPGTQENNRTLQEIVKKKNKFLFISVIISIIVFGAILMNKNLSDNVHRLISENTFGSQGNNLFPSSSLDKFSAWNLPRQDQKFIGRKELLDELGSKLHGTHNSDVKTEVIGKENTALLTVACAGLGGVGKTQLALQYIHHSLYPYTYRIWFPAENINQLRQKYVEFAKELGYIEEKISVENAIHFVKQWLRKKSWLVNCLR